MAATLASGSGGRGHHGVSLGQIALIDGGIGGDEAKPVAADHGAFGLSGMTEGAHHFGTLSQNDLHLAGILAQFLGIAQRLGRGG